MRVSVDIRISVVGLAATLVLLAGCTGRMPTDAQKPSTSGGPASPADTPPVVLPPTSGRFDYQLGGDYSPANGLDVVVRDATGEPLPGAYNVCYVNGFQTQPQEFEAWLADHRELLLTDGAGEPVVDPDWPDEYILDPSTDFQQRGILAVIGPQITDCADHGFDAVEIDNFDTPLRFDHPAIGHIDPQGAQELARSYVAVAHRHGLAVAQKNAAELATAGRDVGFDFAVTEECAAYHECDIYRRAYGDRVLQIEYTDNLPVPFAEVCRDAGTASLAILRDRDLATPESPGYHYERCPGAG